MSKFIKGMAAQTGKPPVSNLPIGKCYAMAVTDDGDAELTLYGDIVQEIPRDWWTDEPIDGLYISLESFMEDLKKLDSAKRITVRLHSVGGDAYASITIHNRLRELAKKAELVTIVDGVAMSGGSLIMCAGDTVKVNPSSLIMVHKCWCFLFGGYNSTELRKVADSNDAVDRAQAAIYCKKTGMSEEEILSLMEGETYMTGEEAMEKGFADKLLDSDKPDIAASADRRSLYVNGRRIRLPAASAALPDSLHLPTVSSAPAAAGAKEINPTQPATTGSQEGGKPMANTIEELRAEYPDLTAQLEAEARAAASADRSAIDQAVSAERTRQQEIDSIAPGVNDESLVRDAKYGENACSAQELAFRAMQKQANQGKSHLEGVQKDYEKSGAADVGAAPPPAKEPGADTKTEAEAQAKADVTAYKEMKEGK